MKFFVNSEQSPIPETLRLARLIGEHHLLTGGGVLDQPVIMIAVNYARYLDDLWQRMSGDGFKPQSESEIKTVEKINDLRREILSGG